MRGSAPQTPDPQPLLPRSAPKRAFAQHRRGTGLAAALPGGLEPGDKALQAAAGSAGRPAAPTTPARGRGRAAARPRRPEPPPSRRGHREPVRTGRPGWSQRGPNARCERGAPCRPRADTAAARAPGSLPSFPRPGRGCPLGDSPPRAQLRCRGSRPLPQLTAAPAPGPTEGLPPPPASRCPALGAPRRRPAPSPGSSSPAAAPGLPSRRCDRAVRSLRQAPDAGAKRPEPLPPPLPRRSLRPPGAAGGRATGTGARAGPHHPQPGRPGRVPAAGCGPARRYRTASAGEEGGGKRR